MPAEYGFIPHGETQEQRAGYILPGEICAIANYSAGNREILVINCRADDSGTEVYVLPEDRFALYQRELPADLLTDGAKDGEIEKDETYTREFVNNRGEVATFFARHFVPQVLVVIPIPFSQN